MSVLTKSAPPFLWGTLPQVQFRQGTASSVDVSSGLINPRAYPISYSIVGTLPAGVTFSGSVLSYNGVAAAGATSVNVRAASGQFVTDSAALTVTVLLNLAPVWLTAAALGTNLVPGAAFSYTLTAQDPEGDAISFAIGTPSHGTVSVTPQSGSTRSLVWSGTVPASGPMSLTVDAT